MVDTDRRSFLKGIGIGLTVGALEGYASSSINKSISTGRTQTPNMLFILADDMRWDALGVAGNRVIHTPNLDQLADDGTFFTNHFVTTSICPTSRASIFTGQYARRHQVWDFSTPLKQEQFDISYPILFHQAGYRTGFIGKWGLGGVLPQAAFDYWRGFEGQGDYWDPTGKRKEHLTRFLGNQALEFLETRKSNQPFCLSISFKAPHAQDGAEEPFQPDPKFASLYDKVTIPRPPTATIEDFARLPSFLQDSEGRKLWEQRFSTEEKYQHSVKQYYRLISGLDAVVGDIISYLKNRNIYDQTYIIFTSDNGFFLGEHGLSGKWWGYEESIRTPLIIKGIEQSPSCRISAMTLNIDLSPTMLDLCGISVPKLVQGKSLFPLLKHTNEYLRKEWFYEHLFEHPGIAKTEGIRTERYKYLRYVDKGQEGESFFDLYFDPYEEWNLANNPGYGDILQQQRILTDQFRTLLAESVRTDCSYDGVF